MSTRAKVRVIFSTFWTIRVLLTWIYFYTEVTRKPLSGIFMRNFGTVAVLVCLLAGTGHVAADSALYRWKDSDGNPVMSDRPPPLGVEYETISTKSSMVHRVEGETPQDPDTTSTPAPKPAPAPAAAKPTSKLHEKNPEYCAAARKNLEVIDRAPRIRIDDGEGGMRYLTDDERDAQRQNNLEIIEAHCP
jgi:hypothetical protein